MNSFRGSSMGIFPLPGLKEIIGGARMAFKIIEIALVRNQLEESAARADHA